MNPSAECKNEFNRDESAQGQNRIYFELDDDYEHICDNVDYIIENVLMESSRSKSFENLSKLFNSFYDTCCNCGETQNCNESRKCKHGGCYSASLTDSNEKELILNKSRDAKDLLYECNSQCSCSLSSCINRLVQFGPRKNLKIVGAKNLDNQLALTTEQFIPEGGFICEYAGELLTESEALGRNMENRSRNLKNYLICLNEYSSNQTNNGETSATEPCIQTFIDAGRKSNIGRYLNHSCDPNCEILSVRIDGPIPKLGIFTRKGIHVGEELCFDYGDVQSVLNEKQPCFCGTQKCRKYF